METGYICEVTTFLFTGFHGFLVHNFLYSSTFLIYVIIM